MAEPNTEPISGRTVRLNQLIMAKTAKTTGGQVLNLLNRESLLDALIVLYEECNDKDLRKDKTISSFVEKFRATVVESKKLRVNHNDFEIKQVIGMGHFGHVQVVRERQTGDIYAMKVLRKSDTLSKQNVAFFEEERDIMAKANSPWITQLQYAFQDKHNIYFVMEFHPGGDLFTLLERFDEVFSEEMTRFYLAEIALAINTLHNMGYVHRDIKPDNILLDRTGHVKLADFGSAAKLTVHGTVISKMPVGTPDYVAPEVLACLENNSGTYGQSCDWWSLGVVAYEMMFGKTPFADDKVVTVYSKIMNHKSTLSFPSDNIVTAEAIALVRGLLEEVDYRFDYTQIVQHSYFKDLIWETIRDSPPPYVPVVAGLDDTSNFTELKPVAHKPDCSIPDRVGFSGRNLPFVGFTYTKLAEVPQNSDDIMASPLRSAGRQSTFNKQLQQLLETNSALERKDTMNNCEIKSLKRRLEGEESALSEAKSSIEALNKKIINLQGEVTSLKKVRELEHAERIKTESKSIEILEKIKGKWKKEGIEKDLAFQKEKDCLMQIIKKCNANYKNEINERVNLQKKYDSLIKLAETYKTSTKVEKEISARRSFSSDAIQSQQMRQQIVTLQRNLDEANERNRTLERQLVTVQATTNELELEVHRLGEAAKLVDEKHIWEKQLSSSLNDLQEKLNESQQHVTELKAALQDKDIDIEVMEKKIKFLCLQNEKLEERVKELLSQKSSDEENVGHDLHHKDVREELRVLKQENKDLLEELLLWKQNDLEKTNIVDDLRNQVTILEEGFKQSSVESFFSASSGSEDETHHEKENRISALCSEIILLKAKISNLETQLERVKENLTREKQEAREVRSDYFKTERELKDAKIDLRIAQRDAKSAMEQLKEFQSKDSQLQAEHDKSVKKISELELSLTKAESELRKVTIRLEYNEKKWETEKGKLEKQIETLKESNMELRDIQIKSDRAEGRIAELVKQIEMSDKQIKTLELESKEWLELKTKLKENLKHEIEKRQNLEKNVEALREISVDLEDQVQQHEALSSKYEAEEIRLNDELKRLESNLKTAKSEVVKAESKIEKEKSKLAEANQRINELERHLEMESVVQDKELGTVVSQKNEYRDKVVELSTNVLMLEEDIKAKDYDIQSCLKKVELLTDENIRVKEETALLITQIQTLRETNVKLSYGLEDAIVKCEELKEQIREREDTLHEVRTTHHADKLKLEETLSQQNKLIGFLQSKLENPVKKKKTLQEKIFGRKHTIAVTSNLNKKPHYKVEMSPSKIYTYSDTQKEDLKTSNEDVKDSYALSKSPSKRDYIKRVESKRSSVDERMHHNIPHRFNIGLCLHATKCAVCLDNIQFGRNVARCEECNVPVHPKCSHAIPDTCSLPVGLMQHYRHSMKRKQRHSKSLVSATKSGSEGVDQESSICGWLKLSKSDSQGWKRVFTKLKGQHLYFYTKEDSCDDDTLVEKFDVCPSDGIVKVIEIVLPSELSDQAKSDIPFIFKMESQPLTTCWPSRSLYLMASSLSEKLNWFSTLENIARNNPNYPTYASEDVGAPLLSLNEVANVDLNCVAFLNDDIFLIGAEEGLYVVDMLNNGKHTLITHFVSIISIQLVVSLKIVLIICGDDHRLFWIEVSVLKKILNGSVKFMAEAMQLLQPVENIDSCHLIVTSETGGNVMLCAATADKICILKWNAMKKIFFLRRILATKEPCGCALFTSDSLIMGTDKFYEIDLETFTVESFLDETDESLQHVVFSVYEMQSFPVAVFQIALSGLPEEYLVCYHEMGVFVDCFGRRTRPKDVTWTRIPLGFAFRWPYLYIIHFNSVEVRKIKMHRDECFEVQTCIEMASPRYMGIGSETGTIVIATMKDDEVHVLNFDGEIALKKKISRLQRDDRNENSNEEKEDSDSVGNFSFTSSILEALGESEL